MDYVALVLIGLLMGLLGGLLGIGGSVVMIPALVLVRGENQHLYQAAAMICNFFVCLSAMVVHKKAKALIKVVLKWMIPAAAVGILIGVAISNSSVFARENSYLLARILGYFMIYVIIDNGMKLRDKRDLESGFDEGRLAGSFVLIMACGFFCAIPAGLLGLGGGLFYIQAQHALLKIPFKRAISNSAATIAAVALIGAFYKNATLAKHGIEIVESLKIVVFIIPGAIVGSIVGSRLLHGLPVKVVRVVFIVFCAVACYKLITVQAAGG